MLKPVPANPLGCTHIGEWSTDDAGLMSSASTCRISPDPCLLRYTSPKTGQAMVVLYVPRLIAADAGAESYYYFPASMFAEHPD
jgi:hypothetical protein